MKCVIVDDDSMVLKVIESYVNKDSRLNLVGVASDGEQGKALIDRVRPDIVFLDIEMPGMNGMELIRSIESSPNIVLISSKKEYAAESYDYDVADFIVKPVEFERFKQSVDKVEQMASSMSSGNRYSKFMFIKDGTVIYKINYADVHWIEALGDYVSVNLVGGKRHTVLSTMKSMALKLPDDFVRIHRSYIIPIEKINEIEDNTVVLNDKLLPVSKHYKENFMRALDLS